MVELLSGLTDEEARSTMVSWRHWAVIVAMACASVGPSSATEVVNGSFESGNFSGWIVQDLSFPFFRLGVAGAGRSPGFGFFSSAPTHGRFAALHGFDGNGPGTIRIGQDLEITTRAPLVQFDYRAAWDLRTFCRRCSDRVFTVNVEVAGGGTNLASLPILVASAGTVQLDTGDVTEIIDLAAFAGQTVRLSFDFHVPDNFSGPAFFQLDNVRVVKDPWAANGSVHYSEPGLLRWKRIVGLQDAGNEVGTGSGRVAGSGQPWSVEGGSAMLDRRTGSLSFHVRGLVLAGGNAIGTTGGVDKVWGTLVCDADGSAAGSSVLVDGSAVRLGPRGNAVFSGSVSPLPAVCQEEPDIAFLIRIPALTTGGEVARSRSSAPTAGTSSAGSSSASIPADPAYPPVEQPSGSAEP